MSEFRLEMNDNGELDFAPEMVEMTREDANIIKEFLKENRALFNQFLKKKKLETKNV